MRTFRRVIFWAHLCTAVVIGAIVLLMSITGVLLTYERQVTWWADTRGVDGGPSAARQARLELDDLIDRAARSAGAEPRSVSWRSDADAPVVVAFGDHAILVNAYTGAVLGETSSGTRAFFERVTGWHRWLGMSDGRRTGRSITGVANLGFLFLVLSGSFLWWPRNRTWKAIRSVLLFRSGLTGRRRDFNWHHVVGAWSVLPLLIIIVSASVISYPWASRLLYGFADGGSAPAMSSDGPEFEPAALPLDASPPARSAALDARAERQVPGWTIIERGIPRAPDASVTYMIDAGAGGQPQKQARLVLDGSTGEVERWAPFSSGTRAARLRSLLRYVHTGEAAGLPGQTVAGLASLGAALLVWTGFSLALRRLLGRLTGRRADVSRSRRQGRRDTRSSMT